MINRALVWVASLTCWPAVCAVATEPARDELDFFESKIRPVLVDHCLACHCDDPDQIEADLDLSDRVGVARGGRGGPAVLPGYPAESLLIAALRYETDALQMPPDEPLPESVIRDFEHWVEIGAPDPREPTGAGGRPAPDQAEIYREADHHWAYQPVQDPAPPTIEKPARAAGEIDRFLLAKLDAEGLTPTDRADRHTLIRRVTYDLTGLPPTPSEIEAFVNDDRADAYRRVVDRLLESTHYGERWGRHWLDIARYADSNGLDEHLAHPSAYRYRDYVVRSFNEDKPYDQFVLEQLAGDLLPSASDGELYRRLIATGFLVIGPKVLAEPDAKKMELDIIDEQVDTLGKAFLGHSIGCARCHDHKFDPISAEDYYAIAGVFGSTRTMEHHDRVARWHERALAKEDAVAAWEEHSERIDDARDGLERFVEHANRSLQRSWIGRLDAFLIAARGQVDDEAEPDATPTPRADGLPARIVRRWREFLASDAAEATPFAIWNRLAAEAAEDGRFDPDSTRATLGSLRDEGAGVQQWMLERLSAPAPESLRDLASGFASLVVNAEGAPGHRPDEPAEVEDSDEPSEQDEPPLLGEGDSIEARVRRELLEPLLKEGGPFYLTPLDDEDDDEEGGEVDLPLYTSEQLSRFEGLQERINRLLQNGPATPEYAMAVAERDEAVDLPVHYRGSYLNLSDNPVPRGAPRGIGGGASPPDVPAGESGRLQLARWIIDPAHPLTARVMVNRIWQGHFGVGLVATPSNFGLTSEPPSHPALLDHLASEFVRSGWSIKALHRRILLSEAYQRSATYNAHAADVDPENRLLWRFSRRRLAAEEIRDAMLAVSGELDATLGGSLFTSNRYAYVDRGAIAATYSSPRRAIYLPIIRTAMYPLFTTFDYNDSHAPTARRPQSTVVQQTLFMLNDPFVMDRARAFATRLLLGEDASAEDRVGDAFLAAYGRPPSADEVARSLELVAASIERRSASTASSGSEAWNATVNAWADLCHAMLASNEFLHVD